MIPNRRRPEARAAHAAAAHACVAASPFNIERCVAVLLSRYYGVDA